jgi:tetratricopeptide (TPR) repeat protein
MQAEIEAATGASFTDDEEPRAAETELLKAVDRLQALEDLLRERDAPQRAIDAVRNQRANALVSLAVNANVRMGDPARALVHFEAAWALRQDEFLRVLLACYRARSGRAAEARAAIATVAPGPGNYYNLACARALLGERDVALRWLEKELRENHAPGGGLERQKAWARKDPDLASLRDDPRFIELVGK